MSRKSVTTQATAILSSLDVQTTYSFIISSLRAVEAEYSRKLRTESKIEKQNIFYNIDKPSFLFRRLQQNKAHLVVSVNNTSIEYKKGIISIDIDDPDYNYYYMVGETTDLIYMNIVVDIKYDITDKSRYSDTGPDMLQMVKLFDTILKLMYASNNIKITSNFRLAEKLVEMTSIKPVYAATRGCKNINHLYIEYCNNLANIEKINAANANISDDDLKRWCPVLSFEELRDVMSLGDISHSLPMVYRRKIIYIVVTQKLFKNLHADGMRRDMANKKKIQEQDAEISQLRSELERLKQELKQKDIQLQESAKYRESVQATLLNNSQLLSTAAVQQEEFQKRIFEANAEIESQKKYIEALEDNFQHMTSEVSRMSNLYESYRHELQTANDEINTSKRLLNDMSSENAQHRLFMNELQEDSLNVQEVISIRKHLHETIRCASNINHFDYTALTLLCRTKCTKQYQPWRNKDGDIRHAGTYFHEIIEINSANGASYGGKIGAWNRENRVIESYLAGIGWNEVNGIREPYYNSMISPRPVLLYYVPESSRLNSKTVHQKTLDVEKYVGDILNKTFADIIVPDSETLTFSEDVRLNSHTEALDYHKMYRLYNNGEDFSKFVSFLRSEIVKAVDMANARYGLVRSSDYMSQFRVENVIKRKIESD